MCMDTSAYRCRNDMFRSTGVDDGGLLSSLSRGALGMRESEVSGSGWRQWIFFGGRWYRDGKRRHHGPWSSNCVSLNVGPSNRPNFYTIKAVSAVVVSLYSTRDMCWFGICSGHGTDVSRTGCARLGSVTRRVSFYTSLVGGGLRLSRSSSGSNGSVRVYRSVM